ncbi:MAG: transposase [Dehalococcoidia bacterium]
MYNRCQDLLEEDTMDYHFLPCARDQLSLLPPALQDWLPEGDLAWFILDAVAQMNLTVMTRTYRADGWGPAAYAPAMMVALSLYAYCLGERSSRRIERLCQRDVAFRVITANQGPDHTTIARFRQTHETELATLFTQVLRLCVEAGLLQVGIVALDDTKITANAALASNRTVETIAAEVSRMLTEAQATEAAEDRQDGPARCGDELPEALRDQQSRLARLQACQARLTQEAATVQQQATTETRQAEEAATGQKKRGRKPKAPEAAADRDATANVTDPDSRIMKTQAGYVQGYHAQAVVTEAQLIVAAEVTQEEKDLKPLHPMLKRAQANLKAIAYPHTLGTALADAGYGSEANLTAADPAGPALLIATNKDWKQRQALREQPPPRGRAPKGLTARDRMERTLLTTRGRRLYTKRGQTVEPMFGQIKSARGCDGFMCRGTAACDSEWKLL